MRFRFLQAQPWGAGFVAFGHFLLPFENLHDTIELALGPVVSLIGRSAHLLGPADRKELTK